MALVHLDGFESYGASGTNGATLQNNLFKRGYQIANVYSGVTYYYEISDVARLSGLSLKGQNALIDKYIQKFFARPSPTMTIGCAYKFLTGAALYSGYPIPFLSFMGLHANPNITICYRSGYGFQIRHDVMGAHLGNIQYPLQEGIWYYIEAKSLCATGTGGNVYIRVNGVDVGNLTGINTGRFTSAGHMGVGLYANLYGWYDDLYVVDDDATGGGTTTYLGPITVENCVPTSDSSVVWTPSGANNYGMIDETPYDTTDYVSSSVMNDTDLYGYANLSLVDANVKGVQVNTVGKLLSVGSRAIEILCNSNGSNASQVIGVAEQSEQGFKPLILEKNPDGAAAWTPTTFNDALFGIKVNN